MQHTRRHRRARAMSVTALVGLLAGSIALIPMRAVATAEPPETAVTSSGRSLAVDITAPSAPARVEAPGSVEIAGTATIGAPQATPLNAGFVVDLSGSTGGSTAYDCNRNGLTDPGDDLNGSGGGYGQLVDCAIAGVLAINGGLVERGNTDAMIVGFAQRAAVADMQATSGDQPFTASGNDSAPPVPGDVETVARSLRPNIGSASIDQYTARSGLGSSSEFGPAIRALVDTMAAQPASEERVAFLIADGAPTDTTALPIADLTAAHIKVNTFAVGPSTTCDAGGALASIASATGGTCTRVASPAAFTSVIAEAATIAAVEYSVDGGAFAPVTTFDATSGAFTLDLPVTLGDHAIRVRARAADGTLAQSTLELTGVDAPDVASEVFATAEGTPLAVPGRAFDDDTADTALTFAWTPPDGRLSSTTTEDTTFVADDNGTFTYELTATDPDGLSGSGTKQITVANVAPTIDAVHSPSPVNEGALSAFSVDFSDPGTADAHEVRFSWGDGTPDDIVTVDERSANHTAVATHTYAVGAGDPTLVVTVTDDDGDSASTQQVIDINHGPTAALDGAAYSVTEGGTITITSSFADVDGDDLTAALSIAGAVAASGPVASGGSLSTSVAPPATADEGTIAIASQVSDSFGLVGTDSATLTVLNANPVITELQAPTETLPDLAVSITGALTDAGVDDVHTVSVDWGDASGALEPGTTSTTSGAGTFSASHTYGAFGTYDGVVRLCDTDGGCTERPFTIAVGTPPTAHAGDDVTLVEGDVLTLTGSATDADTADGEQLSYRWSPADGQLIGTTTATPTFYAVDDGVFTYTLEVCDSQGACGTDAITITVANAPPSSLSLAVIEDRAAGLVRLTADWTDSGAADTSTLAVDWGDGGAAEPFTFGAGETEAFVSHAYGTPGSYTITGVVTDDDGGSVGGSVAASVMSNRAPVASAGGPYVVNEGSPLALDGSATDPDGDAVSVTWNDAARFSAGRTTTSPTFAPADGSAGGTSYPVELVATDALGAQSTASTAVVVHNIAPTISNITGPTAPAPVGTNSSLTVVFTDPSPTDTHVVELDWDDGTPSSAITTSGARQATATHTYGSPGVYTVTATVRDSDGAQSAPVVFEYVVIYDPSAGFVTGAGSIMSPAGAYSGDLTAAGKATFGIASKYMKGSTVPSGETEFQLKSAGFEFKSTANEYLVLSGSKATYRGVGDVNGVAGYGFQVTVIDGAKMNTSDKLRIKIWQGSQGNVVYDNERSLPDGSDPITSVSTGSIVIHRA